MALRSPDFGRCSDLLKCFETFRQCRPAHAKSTYLLGQLRLIVRIVCVFCVGTLASLRKEADTSEVPVQDGQDGTEEPWTLDAVQIC